LRDELVTIEEEPVLRRVGRYEILREIGRGGTAVVYLARQTDLGRPVALKELAAFHAADAVVVERFLRESRLAGSLSHPNVVTVHEYFEHEATPFIAMEYFERGSLRQLLPELALPQVVGVLEGVLAGLAHAESRRIVHRDLKPENVMVTSAGTVKIGDFGIAKAFQDTSQDPLTTSGTTVGTPAYMAPELALGAAIGPWTDLYAVGVMAYEMMAGRPPFDGAEMPVAVLLRHIHEPVPSLRATRPDLDARLVRWIERLLAKAPHERPRSAGEAWEELEEAAISALGPRWRRDAQLGEDGQARYSSQPPTPRSSSTWDATRVMSGRSSARVLRWARRRPRLAAGAAALLFAAGGAGAAVALVSSDTPSSKGQGARNTTGARPIVPDYIPDASNRHVVAVSGPSVFVGDARGRVLALDRTGLDRRQMLADPAGPRSLAVHGGRLYVADTSTVMTLEPATLAPVAARSWRDARLAGGSGAPLFVAWATGGGRGRVCELRAGLQLGACTNTGFVPSGVGVTGGRVFLANGPAGTIVELKLTHDGLVRAGPPIAVSSRPRGTLAVFHGSLYATIKRGIVVVNLSTRGRRTVALPATPSSLWIAPTTGTLFATVPATNEVAVVDTANRTRMRLVEVGSRPVMVAGGRAGAAPNEVYVAGAAGGRITRLDARSGAVRGAIRVSGFGAAAPRPVVVVGAKTSDEGDATTLQLALEGGALARAGVIAADLEPRDGSVSVAVWQGAIRSTFATKRLGQISLRVRRAAAHLELAVVTPRNLYASAALARPNAHTIVLELIRAPRVAQGGGGDTKPTTGGGSGQTKPGTTDKKPTGDGGGEIIQF
jgi:hypothetical protein